MRLRRASFPVKKRVTVIKTGNGSIDKSEEKKTCNQALTGRGKEKKKKKRGKGKEINEENS